MKTADILRKLLIVLLVGAVASPLAGCGRKGSPKDPPNAENSRVYPTK